MPALAPAPQPDPCALGSRRGHLVWLGSGRISPARGFSTPTLLGTTDFTLHDPKHRICPCPSVPAAAGAVQAEHGGCWGHAWPTVTRTRGQGDSWLYSEPRDTAQGSPTTAEGDGGRDELALRWPFASQVLEVGRSPLQGPARSRHSERCSACTGESFQTSPYFLRSRLTPCNTTGFCCSSSSRGILALGLGCATLRPHTELCQAAGHGLEEVTLQWHFLKAEMGRWKHEVETWPHAGRASLGLPACLPRHTPSLCSLPAPGG